MSRTTHPKPGSRAGPLARRDGSMRKGDPLTPRRNAERALACRAPSGAPAAAVTREHHTHTHALAHVCEKVCVHALCVKACVHVRARACCTCGPNHALSPRTSRRHRVQTGGSQLVRSTCRDTHRANKSVASVPLAMHKISQTTCSRGHIRSHVHLTVTAYM